MSYVNDPHGPARTRWRQIFHAIEINSPVKASQVLAQGGLPSETRRFNGPAVLFAAAYAGNVAISKLLLDAGVDPNAKSHGRTMLTAAVLGRSLDVCRLLLVAGALVDTKDDRGQGPLHHAVAHGYEEVCAELLEFSPDLSIPGETDLTPLCMAVERSDRSMCRLLLKAGADINLRNRRQQKITALHLAVLLAETDMDAAVSMCRMLVAYGAGHVNGAYLSINQLPHTSYTPFQLAAMMGYTEVVRYFAVECGEDLYHRAPRAHRNRQLRYQVGKGTMAFLEQVKSDLKAQEVAMKDALGAALISAKVALDCQNWRMRCANAL